MQIVRDAESLAAALKDVRKGGRLALVPTMGALHDGHLALVAAARRHADRVAATIFVNPLQFNDPRDLERYPRTLDADLAKLKAACCDLVWLPEAADLYPDGMVATVRAGAVGRRWEGEHRPGHFDGVATVVARLFKAVRPDVALFGEKDFQQLAVIRRMVADLDLPPATLSDDPESGSIPGSLEHLLGGLNLGTNPSEPQREAARRALRTAVRAVRELYFPDVTVIGGSVGLADWLADEVAELGLVRSPFGTDAGLHGAAALAIHPGWR